VFDEVYILFHFNSSTSVNFVQEYGIIMLSNISTFLSLWLPLFTLNILFLRLCFLNWMCWFCMPLYYVYLRMVIYHPNMCMDNLWYYINFVYLLVCMDDVVHIYVLINRFLCFIYNIVWNFMVISLFISLVLFFIGVHFVVVYMLLIVRNWASWFDRPFIRGDVENDFNLLLSTNILSLAVPESFWILVAKLTVCDRFFFFSSSSSSSSSLQLIYLLFNSYNWCGIIKWTKKQEEIDIQEDMLLYNW
jgi:hypothetical protein